MIQLFKKANDKAGSEVDPKDPTKQKWNADAVFVQIENEMVPLSELAKHAKENEYAAIPETIENEMEINGSLHNVSDLIARYKASKKNEESVDVKKKDPAEKTDEERKKDEEGDTAEDKKQAKKNEEEDKKKEEEKENATPEEKGDKGQVKKEGEKMSEEDDVEEKIKKQNAKDDKKDVRHFVRLNTARENGTTDGVLIIDTMHNRIDRGRNRYGTGK